MAVQSNLKNMALVLTLTCLFCSAILGGAYALTKDPIDKAAEAKTAKAIGAVLPEFDATSYETVSVDGKDFNYYLAKKGSETVGYAVESSTSGFGGPLSLIVGITADGVVYNTSVLSHSETTYFQQPAMKRHWKEPENTGTLSSILFREVRSFLLPPVQAKPADPNSSVWPASYLRLTGRHSRPKPGSTVLPLQPFSLTPTWLY